MADNNTILEKLEGLVARFEEVSTLITDPAVIADQKRYVKLTKEYKELGDLMKPKKLSPTKQTRRCGKWHAKSWMPAKPANRNWKSR